MNIEIVQGRFAEAIKYCERKNIRNIQFELSFIESDKGAQFEFNRFIEEIKSRDVVGECDKKRIILNLSSWNDKFSYNKYLEAFLYMMCDMSADLEYKIILEKELNQYLYKQLVALDLFECILTELPSMIKQKSEIKIGFSDNSASTEVERNV